MPAVWVQSFELSCKLLKLPLRTTSDCPSEVGWQVLSDVLRCILARVTCHCLCQLSLGIFTWELQTGCSEQHQVVCPAVLLERHLVAVVSRISYVGRMTEDIDRAEAAPRTSRKVTDNEYIGSL